MDDPRYPLGKFAYDAAASDEKRNACISDIRAVPALLRRAVEGLPDDLLDTPYREGGWTVRQLVHHVADSHLNAYQRFRLALTEDEPTIRPYDEKGWAELPDARTAAPEVSLSLLEALHARWVALLETLESADFARTLVHPENGVLTLDRMLQLYAWHGRHHVAHVREFRSRGGHAG